MWAYDEGIGTMSDLQVNPGDMSAASNAATQAAENASGHGSSDDLATAGAAIPGAGSVGYLSELGGSWDEEVEAWADSARTFGSEIAAASDEVQGADGEAGGWFGGLLGKVGGN